MTNRESWGIAAIRVMVGIVFFAHGAQKLFVYGMAGVSGAMGSMGIPLPHLAGPLVTLVEFLGGLGLITGLLTRWAALGLAINMTVAVLAVHLKGGFFLPRGYEYALTLLVTNAGLVIAGPGAFALDNLLRRRKGGAPELVKRAA